jgi:hypothetical protein
MNKIDETQWVADFRASVPLPSQARLAAGRERLLAAVTGPDQPGQRHRPAAGRRFLQSRPMVALAAAMVIAVTVAYALTASAGGPAQTKAAGRATHPATHPATRPGMRTGQATQPATLAVKVLHAAAAQVAREAATAEPSPGQWIYYTEVNQGRPPSVPTPQSPEWITFDGGQTAYYQGSGGPLIVHTNSTSFPPPGTGPWTALNTYGISPKIAWDVLASLPADPRALLTVIAHQVATPTGKQFAAGSVTRILAGAPTTAAQLEFDYLTRILWNAHLGGPPTAQAAVYRAMATLPRITVQQGITDAAGARAIGISDDGGYNQLLLSPVTYQVIGWRVISNGHALKRLRGPSWPRGTLILSTALTQVSEVAAPGDR